MKIRIHVSTDKIRSTMHRTIEIPDEDLPETGAERILQIEEYVRDEVEQMIEYDWEEVTDDA